MLSQRRTVRSGIQRAEVDEMEEQLQQEEVLEMVQHGKLWLWVDEAWFMGKSMCERKEEDG